MRRRVSFPEPDPKAAHNQLLVLVCVQIAVIGLLFAFAVLPS